MAWGTPIMMLGRVGDSGCAPCALGRSSFSRALPAGSVAGGFGLGALAPGMGPEPWASYPGSGGPNRVVTDVNGASPDWYRNTITMPVISPDDPQNRQRVFNGGIYDPSWDPRTGKAIRGYGTTGLGNLVRPWDGSGADSFTMGVRGLGGGCSSLGDWWKPQINSYTVLGAAVGAAHGYARNKKVGWALAWGVAGFFAPIFTSAIAIVQGLGKSKSGG